MAIQESGEMYLETILVLTKDLKRVRSIDISRQMNYSKPSVSRAVSVLKSEGLIIVDDSGYIWLTESGKEIAERIYERHNVITAILTQLGVSEKTAAEDACRIEHVISIESFEAIKRHISSAK